jgi:hypothetical protein
MPTNGGSNVDRLTQAGLIVQDHLPEPYDHVVAGLTDHEVDILVAVKNRLVAADAWHGQPGPQVELPRFTSFIIF